MTINFLNNINFILYYIILWNQLPEEIIQSLFGDWGLGIGDWGLGIGQSPIPNPHYTKIT